MANQQQVLEKLTLLTQTVSKKQIETDLEMPKNCLSGIMSGSKNLPKKWVGKIMSYEPATLSKVDELLKTIEELKKENEDLKLEITILREIKTDAIEKHGKASKKEEKPVNGLKTTNKDEIQAKIDELKKVAENCGNTYLGRVAKSDYLHQINELKKGLL